MSINRVKQVQFLRFFQETCIMTINAFKVLLLTWNFLEGVRGAPICQKNLRNGSKLEQNDFYGQIIHF